MSKETYVYSKKRPYTSGISDTFVADTTTLQEKNKTHPKETYLYGKRDLLMWQKRPMYRAKEAL